MSEIDEKYRVFSEKLSFLKIFFCTRRLQFWQPGGKFFDRKPNTFGSMSENDEKYRLLPKNYFAKNNLLDTENAVLAINGKKVWPETEHFWSISENDEKYWLFFRRTIFLKSFFWTSRTEYWQPLGKFFDRKPITFWSISEKDEKHRVFSEEQSFPYSSSGRVECSFHKPAEKYFTDCGKLFPQGPKNILKIFQKNFLPQKCFVGQ